MINHVPCMWAEIAVKGKGGAARGRESPQTASWSKACARSGGRKEDGENTLRPKAQFSGRLSRAPVESLRSLPLRGPPASPLQVEMGLLQNPATLPLTGSCPREQWPQRRRQRGLPAPL